MSPAPDDPPDRELLQRALAGDRVAFGAVYSRYQSVVYRFARAMTGSADAAADVTQEVFVTLIRNLRRYDPDRATLSTYLYGVARNMSRHRLRRERRFLSLDRLARVAAGRRCDDPAREFTGVEDAARVRAALRLLPVRYREAIILCDLHEVSYADAAAIVRTSVGAVRSRLHRGRRLLRDRLKQMDEAMARHEANPARCSI
jgi:RNA polymerase sigma-70 factor (ECF subfamily)